jgi:hypothetical protein
VLASDDDMTDSNQTPPGKNDGFAGAPPSTWRSLTVPETGPDGEVVVVGAGVVVGGTVVGGGEVVVVGGVVVVVGIVVVEMVIVLDVWLFVSSDSTIRFTSSIHPTTVWEPIVAVHVSVPPGPPVAVATNDAPGFREVVRVSDHETGIPSTSKRTPMTVPAGVALLPTLRTVAENTTGEPEVALVGVMLPELMTRSGRLLRARLAAEAEAVQVVSVTVASRLTATHSSGRRTGRRLVMVPSFAADRPRMPALGRSKGFTPGPLGPRAHRGIGTDASELEPSARC